MPPKSASVDYRLDVREYVHYNFQLALCHTACFGFPYLLCLPCEVRNLTDFAEAVRVRLTASELIYERGRIKTCWRLPMCDQGRVEKVIPFEKITDVVLQEPAGGCPPKTLYTLKIQTAGNSGIPGSELEIIGLSERDSKDLKERLTTRKRTSAPSTMVRN